MVTIGISRFVLLWLSGNSFGMEKNHTCNFLFVPSEFTGPYFCFCYAISIYTWIFFSLVYAADVLVKSNKSIYSFRESDLKCLNVCERKYIMNAEMCFRSAFNLINQGRYHGTYVYNITMLRHELLEFLLLLFDCRWVV